MIHLIYPEKSKVSEETLMIWASDAYTNDETEEEALNVEDAIRILEDLGHITVRRVK
jgi:hypothetical protein